MDSAPVVVLGANGQLGTDICTVLREHGYDVRALTHADVDLRDSRATRAVVSEHGPSLVVNTAAAHNLKECESNPELAFAVNAIAVRNLADIAADLDASLIHMSTDYVFGGESTTPYLETDRPAPVNVYGNSKLSGEQFLASGLERHLIVRSSALYGANPCRAKGGLNFVGLMLRLARERGRVNVVTDEFVSPTYTVDLARQIEKAYRAGCRGVIHATSGGECSWFEFAAAIFEMADVDVDLRPTTSASFDSLVRRPAYSILENSRLRSSGIDIMPDWKDSLRRYLAQIGEGRSADRAVRSDSPAERTRE